jgi:hypothetical protein
VRTKYPRTYHLPWSLGATSDDKTHSEAAVEAMFAGREIVVTEKMDGENTTVYADGYLHARSIDSSNHPSRNWAKAQVAPALLGNLPAGWRVCGENLYAKHSLGYEALPTYFMVFAIYDEQNRCLSWDETVEWCELLGLTPVPVLYRGPWDEAAVRACYTGKSQCGAEGEGYVVRVAGSFAYGEFSSSVAKFVRANHVVEGSEHWAHAALVPNRLQEAE